VSFYKNGTLQGTGNYTWTGTDSVGSRVVVDSLDSTGAWQMNFGQRAFAYTAPSGFKALCTTNLPTPTIGATSTTLANKYFDVKTYLANASTQTITGIGFQPDMFWGKRRDASATHNIVDAVRGVTKYLYSNLTDAEGTWTDKVTAFTSDGFSLGADTTGTGQVNFVNNATQVAWLWNAGGSNATNTSGTITSTVRANTTSGFSIVTYTGNGTAGATVGHGLGVAPSMVITKGRDSVVGATNWKVYHSSLGNTKNLNLNLTNAEATSSTVWNNTTPTSTVFSLGSNGDLNGSTATYVAYCFAPVAGYSAFGSYTGNGSSDGPMIFTGFRPRYVMVKRTDASGNEWEIRDTARDSYNSGTSARLWASSSASELNDFPADILSNGFKPRSTGTNSNGSGATYIYMAFAESPFKYSLAR
jgi:hypothetical protein